MEGGVRAAEAVLHHARLRRLLILTQSAKPPTSAASQHTLNPETPFISPFMSPFKSHTPTHIKPTLPPSLTTTATAATSTTSTRQRAVPAAPRGGLRRGPPRPAAGRRRDLRVQRPHVLWQGGRGVARRDRLRALPARAAVRASGPGHGPWGFLLWVAEGEEGACNAISG